jgi:FkbM family methyltransferase
MGTKAAEFEQELEALLAEGVEGARSREAAEFDRLAGPDAKDIVLFGAGNLGRRTLAGLRKIGIEPLAFIDNNSARWGERQNGLDVLRPEGGAMLYGDRAAFVVTVWGAMGADRMSTRLTQLRQLGCHRVVPFLPLYWKYPDAFLPHYTQDLPHLVHLHAERVRQAFHLMADDVSRREYLAQLRFRLLGDFEGLPSPVAADIYFRDDLFRLRDDEIFVDCGAFDGDTLNLFLGKAAGVFKRAIAFEPDPENFVKLAKLVSNFPEEARSRIVLHQAATGESNGRLLMDTGNGPSSQIGSGDCEINCVALDLELHDVPATFIKMDIEGSELAALAGAQELIRKNKPILAISAYHRQSDLWNIPLFVHDLNPRYSFHLRPHMLEGWDLVCYAVPSSRRR